jgi:hypothetical protein
MRKDVTLVQLSNELKEKLVEKQLELTHKRRRIYTLVETACEVVEKGLKAMEDSNNKSEFEPVIKFKDGSIAEDKPTEAFELGRVN